MATSVKNPTKAERIERKLNARAPITFLIARSAAIQVTDAIDTGSLMEVDTKEPSTDEGDTV